MISIFVTVPKDLAAVKSKVVFNLTKRQLICFGAAALLGLPVFFATKGELGSSIAILLMIVVMLPMFFIGMYEKDGLPAEKIAYNILRTKLLWPAVRVYETDNFYEALHKQESARKEGALVRIKAETARKHRQSKTRLAKARNGKKG